MIAIGRPREGISLNGLEYLLTDVGDDVMTFESKENAMDFLRRYAFPGATDEELNDYFTFLDADDARERWNQHSLFKNQYALVQHGNVILTGDKYQVRERIEELLEKHFGFFISLQENTDDEEAGYLFYLHSDCEEDLTQEDLDKLDSGYGINTHDDSNSQFMIEKLLDIRVRRL